MYASLCTGEVRVKTPDLDGVIDESSAPWPGLLTAAGTLLAPATRAIAPALFIPGCPLRRPAAAAPNMALCFPKTEREATTKNSHRSTSKVARATLGLVFRTCWALLLLWPPTTLMLLSASNKVAVDPSDELTDREEWPGNDESNTLQELRSCLAE